MFRPLKTTLAAILIVLGLHSASAQQVTEQEPAATQTASVGSSGQQKQSFFAGLEFSSIGTFDSVNIVGKDGSNSGDILEVDGTWNCSWFVEFKGDETQTGVQSFRYEKSCFNPAPSFDNVSPVDQRGQSGTSIKDENSDFAKLQSNIAPIQSFPEFKLNLIEEYFTTEVTINDNVTQQLYYIPYGTDQENVTLSPGETYVFEVNLEEIMYSYQINDTFKASAFDLVYQKPILVNYAYDASTDAQNIFMPLFEAKGVFVEAFFDDIPFVYNGRLSIHLGYGKSTEGIMTIKNIPTSSGTRQDSYGITVDKYLLDIVGRWDNFYISAYLNILEMNTVSLVEQQESSLISLDSIIKLSASYGF